MRFVKTYLHVFAFSAMFSAVPCYGAIGFGGYEYSTINIQNKDCNDGTMFHIYTSGSDDNPCTLKEDYVINKNTTDNLRVMDGYTVYSNGKYSHESKCTYAVEVVGEIAGGFKYEGGDSVTCKMKQTGFWKQCRCN